jgi:phospholipid-binding lipoprotein MlaA
MLRILRAAALLAMAAAAAGCATTPGRTTPDDRWEGFNRGVYKFNDAVDRAALKPVAKGYVKITPRWMRRGISNFFGNLAYPTTIVNQFLQGKVVLGLKDTGRLIVNSTIGLAGFIDVATRLGLEANDEDFGQTLAVWGVGSGPYLTLPFFGPSTLRDAPSRIVDYFTDPLTEADLRWEEEWVLRVFSVVNARAELLPLDGTLQRTFDPYAFIRDSWVQRREFEIFDGNPPPPALEDEFMDEEGMPLDEAPEDDAAGAAPESAGSAQPEEDAAPEPESEAGQEESTEAPEPDPRH